ncbi:hypothetical protein Tco_1560785 [Tanacetum coccineum]
MDQENPQQNIPYESISSSMPTFESFTSQQNVILEDETIDVETIGDEDKKRKRKAPSNPRKPKAECWKFFDQKFEKDDEMELLLRWHIANGVPRFSKPTPVNMTIGTHDDEAGSSRSKRSRQHETVEEVLLPQVHHEFLLWEGCNRDAKSRRFGTKSSVELEEEGFNVYFEGGLHSDEHFNAHDYWLSISQEENLGLSRSHTSTIKKPILRVIHKMITYGLCQRTTRKRAGTQKESQICCGQFISKIARKCRVLTEDVSSVPRVGIPRPPRASMQDLYDRMGRMEIR